MKRLIEINLSAREGQNDYCPHEYDVYGNIIGENKNKHEFYELQSKWYLEINLIAKDERTDKVYQTAIRSGLLEKEDNYEGVNKLIGSLEEKLNQALESLNK